MRRTLSIAATGLAIAGLIAAAPTAQSSSADQEVEMTVGDSLTVIGEAGAGTNASYFDNFECDADPDSYCQTVLVKLTNPYEEENAKKGRERASLDLYLAPDFPVNDMDMAVFESDADGAQGAQLGQSGNAPIADCVESCETINAVITTTVDSQEVYVLVHVVYFAAAGGWTLDMSFT